MVSITNRHRKHLEMTPPSATTIRLFPQFYLRPNPVFPRPAGLTLLELLVVLTILIALSGIVVATLPGLLRQTQLTASATNLQEIDAGIRRSQLMNRGSIGDRFDSLIASTGNLNGVLAEYTGLADEISAVSLTAEDVAALAQIGVTELVPADKSPQNVTFDSHQQPSVKISASSKVAAIRSDLSPVVARALWNMEPPADGELLVFGLGSQCSLVGRSTTAVFAEAPLYLSDQPTGGPQTTYARFLVVVELKRESSRRSSARYIGPVVASTKGLQGLSGQLEDFYATQ